MKTTTFKDVIIPILRISDEAQDAEAYLQKPLVTFIGDLTIYLKKNKLQHVTYKHRIYNPPQHLKQKRTHLHVNETDEVCLGTITSSFSPIIINTEEELFLFKDRVTKAMESFNLYSCYGNDKDYLFITAHQTLNEQGEPMSSWDRSSTSQKISSEEIIKLICENLAVSSGGVIETIYNDLFNEHPIKYIGGSRFIEIK